MNFILKMFGMNWVKKKYNNSHITQNVSVFNSDVNNICENFFTFAHLNTRTQRKKSKLV